MNNAYLPGMGRVILLSQADMEDMQKERGYDNLGVVPYGIDRVPEEVSYPVSVNDTRGMIVFSGNMFHRPNVDGALHFLRNMFPKVLAGYPGRGVVGSSERILTCGSAKRRPDSGSCGHHGEGNERDRIPAPGVVSVCPVRLQSGARRRSWKRLRAARRWCRHTPEIAASGLPGKQILVEDDGGICRRVVTLLAERLAHALRRRAAAGRKDVFMERSAAALEAHIAAVRDLTTGKLAYHSFPHSRLVFIMRTVERPAGIPAGPQCPSDAP